MLNRRCCFLHRRQPPSGAIFVGAVVGPFWPHSIVHAERDAEPVSIGLPNGSAWPMSSASFRYAPLLSTRQASSLLAVVRLAAYSSNLAHLQLILSSAAWLRMSYDGCQGLHTQATGSYTCPGCDLLLPIRWLGSSWLIRARGLQVSAPRRKSPVPQSSSSCALLTA